MDELSPRPATSGRLPHGSLDPVTARRALVPLLAGYLTFGQFWGIWVILVVEFQQFHELSESRLGAMYTMLSLTAVVVMLVLAPRLQRLPLSTVTPVSLLVLAVGTAVIAYQPSALVVIGFLLVGAGNGLIDVYMNVAAQRVEVVTPAGAAMAARVLRARRGDRRGDGGSVAGRRLRLPPRTGVRLGLPGRHRDLELEDRAPRPGA
ncbi:MAG: hypothetical protein ACRDHI_12765 [Actinomycetota bacterium]